MNDFKNFAIACFVVFLLVVGYYLFWIAVGLAVGLLVYVAMPTATKVVKLTKRRPKKWK